MQPSVFVLALLTVSAGWSPARAQACISTQAAVGLDHVVVAVSDLAGARGRFGELGFTVKEGRLHPNGLRNAHIEFSGGTELELMALEGPPADAMAEGYARFLADGVGGAFLALGAGQSRVIESAGRAGVAAEILDAGIFRYVTFSAPHLADVFTIEYARPQAPTATRHANAAGGLDEVWLEADADLGALLVELGAVPCGPVRGPLGVRGSAYGVRNGSVVVVPPRERARPRVLGVALQGPTNGEPGALTRIAGIWLTFGGSLR